MSLRVGFILRFFSGAVVVVPAEAWVAIQKTRRQVVAKEYYYYSGVVRETFCTSAVSVALSRQSTVVRNLKFRSSRRSVKRGDKCVYDLWSSAKPSPNKK